MPIIRLPAIAAVAAMTLLGACSVFGGPAAPEPNYDVVRSEGSFEIRDYPELVVVGTAMSDGSSDAFGKLFDYISGANRAQDKIAMTAPVLQSPEDSTEIAMTAPVLRGADADGRVEMLFVLPETFTPETAPEPTDPSVRLSTIPSRRVAVLRFSGLFRDPAIAENTKLLQDRMQAEGLEPVGPPEAAGYNPPWTLPPLRRNEILIPIARN
ncbi:MAG: heme-binding protein [Pseudomonadota bacterium]